MNEQRNKNRWILIGLAVLFMVPVLAALYLNSNLTDWKPGSLNVKGSLIEPVLIIPGQQQVEAAPWREGLWSMLVVADADCDQQCLRGIEKSVQVYSALGRLQSKIKIVVMINSESQLPAQLAAKLTRIEPVDGLVELLAEHQLDAEVYLVDPFANLMMRYINQFDASGMRKDLQRLLKHDYE